MINKEAYDMYSVQTMTEYYEGKVTIFMIYVTLTIHIHNKPEQKL